MTESQQIKNCKNELSEEEAKWHTAQKLRNGLPRARLCRVARIFEGYGRRLQSSVFECNISDAQHEFLRARLLKTIHAREDSLRIYTLRRLRDQYIESHERDNDMDFHDALIV